MTIVKEKELSASDIQSALERMVDEIAERHAKTGRLLITGIAEGGVPLAKKIATQLSEKLGKEILQGVVDVSFHRDDIGSNPIPKITMPTELPGQVDGSCCVLVDDVIYTGRSARAALNELFGQGRLEQIELAVLVDRGNRQLPIQPDYTGFMEETSKDQDVTVVIDLKNPNADKVQITAK